MKVHEARSQERTLVGMISLILGVGGVFMFFGFLFGQERYLGILLGNPEDIAKLATLLVLFCTWAVTSTLVKVCLVAGKRITSMNVMAIILAFGLSSVFSWVFGIPSDPFTAAVISGWLTWWALVDLVDLII